jgi:hypothetical protein
LADAPPAATKVAIQAATTTRKSTVRGASISGSYYIYN